MTPSVQANGKTKKKRRNTKQKTKGENTKRLATTAGLLLPRAFSPCLNLMEFWSVDLKKKTVMDNCCTYNSASLLNAKDVQDFCTFSIFFLLLWIKRESSYSLLFRLIGNYQKFYSAIKASYPDINIVSSCDKSTISPSNPADLYDVHVRSLCYVHSLLQQIRHYG
jgi:hypothetical protein